MARNRYNQYAQPYLPPQSGASYVYQPTYDESFYEDYSRIGKEKQQRFDVGRQQFSDFTGTAGAVDTFDPNALQERIGGFSDSVQEMVDTQFGGDYGLAANDIADMIAEEKGQTFYKANRFQQEQAKLQQAAQGRKRGLGESLIVQNDATQANLQDAIDSGNYQEALRYQGIEAPNYDKLATSLVKDVRADSFAGLTGLNQNEKELLSEAVGSGNIDGFLANYKSSGTKGKLSKDDIRDALAESFYNQASEPLLAQARIAYPEASNEELNDIAMENAQGHIANKIPQLSFQQESRIGQKNYSPKVESTPDGYGGVPSTRTTNQQVYSANTDKFIKQFGDTEVDISVGESIDPSAQKTELAKIAKDLKIVEAGVRNLTPAQMKSSQGLLDKKNALKARKEELTSQVDTYGKNKPILDQIESFESSNNIGAMYKDWNSKSNYGKAKEIAKLEDAYNSYNKNFLTFQNFYQDENAAVKGASQQLAEGRLNVKSVTNTDGESFTVKNNKVVIPGWFNNKPLEDFAVEGINPYNGKIIAKADNQTIEYYPNDQAETIGLALEGHNENLRSKGFSVLMPPTGVGDAYLVVKKFDPSAINKTLPNGSLQDLAIKIPANKVNEMYNNLSANPNATMEEALDYYKGLSLDGNRINNHKLMVNYMRDFGDMFEYSTKEDKKD